jgi:hypothetical protein
VEDGEVERSREWRGRKEGTRTREEVREEVREEDREEVT